MNIAKLLRARARTCPEAAAIIDAWRGRSRCTSFAELELAAARAAALLRQGGLRRGDAVLVFHPMSAELYIALIAIFRLGLVAMFLDPSVGREHIEQCCDIRPPRALIASSKTHLLRLFSPALRRIPLKFSVGLPVPGAVSWERAAHLAPHEDVLPSTPDTPALLTFTSGTTGQPKAAVRTHGFLLAQHRVLEQALGLTAGEVDLTTLPIFALANLASGVTSLIPDADLRRPGAIDPAPVVAQIQAHRPTRTAASPALLECLAGYCARHDLKLRSFRKIFTGGAPVFPRLLDQLQHMAPSADIIAVYGSTEAEPIAHVATRSIEPEDIAAMLAGRGLLAGQPVPAIQLRIIRNQWGRPISPCTGTEFAMVCLRPGEAGEIVISGKHVLPGYLHGRGNETAKFEVDGTPWHRTGDAGYLDNRGRLWLLGRCAARVEDARGTLYPFTVECVAQHQPGVRRAALVSHRGQRILSVEFYDHAANTNLALLKETLAWAHIDKVQGHKQIPVDKRHNAKIYYPALHKLLDEAGKTDQ